MVQGLCVMHAGSSGPTRFVQSQIIPVKFLTHKDRILKSSSSLSVVLFTIFSAMLVGVYGNLGMALMIPGAFSDLIIEV